MTATLSSTEAPAICGETTPLRPLGEVLARSTDWITLDPTEVYTEVTVRLWGKGVIARGEKLGGEIGGTRRLRVHPREFILSRIDARNGAFGLVPAELDGAVVSNDFPCFRVDESALLPEYLGWLSWTRWFSEACKLVSEGTTNRVRLNEEKFLAIRIPLPPVDEQQRIVAKIKGLAVKIDAAHSLRRRSTVELDACWKSTSREVFSGLKGANRVVLEDVCNEIVDCLHSNPVYADAGIPTLRSPDIGWGCLYLDQARKTSEEEYRRRTRRSEPQAGDIVLVREGGGTGKAGLVEEGQRLSLGQRVMQLRPNKDAVEPRYLLQHWLSPVIQEDQIKERMKGSASPHLNIRAIKKFELALPPLEVQRRIITYLDGLQTKVDRLKALQQKTAAELDALLPSILDKAFKGEL